MISLVHRDASSSMDSMWEYESGARSVLLIIAGIALEVPVCTEAHPFQHAYSIKRVDEQTWRLAPARYEREGKAWIAKPCPYPDSGVEAFVDLVCAPALVSAKLAEL